MNQLDLISCFAWEQNTLLSFFKSRAIFRTLPHPPKLVDDLKMKIVMNFVLWQKSALYFEFLTKVI
jgi:hypothetical protein